MPPSGTTAGMELEVSCPAALRLPGLRGKEVSCRPDKAFMPPSGINGAHRCSPAKRSASRERSFDNAIASEPRLKHSADVQRIQLLVLGAVYLRGVLVIHRPPVT